MSYKVAVNHFPPLKSSTPRARAAALAWAGGDSQRESGAEKLMLDCWSPPKFPFASAGACITISDLLSASEVDK